MALTVIIEELLSLRAVQRLTFASTRCCVPEHFLVFAVLDQAFALARINIPSVVRTSCSAVFRLADAFAARLIPNHLMFSTVKSLGGPTIVSWMTLTTAIVVVEVVVNFTLLFNAQAGSTDGVPCVEGVVTVLHLIPACAVIFFIFFVPPDELAGRTTVLTRCQ